VLYIYVYEVALIFYTVRRPGGAVPVRNLQYRPTGRRLQQRLPGCYVHDGRRSDDRFNFLFLGRFRRRDVDFLHRRHRYPQVNERERDNCVRAMRSNLIFGQSQPDGRVDWPLPCLTVSDFDLYCRTKVDDCAAYDLQPPMKTV